MVHPQEYEEYMGRLDEAVHFLAASMKRKPTIGVVLGSGLGGFAEYLEAAGSIDYVDIPQWPKTSTQVEGHAGRLIHGPVGEHYLAILSGRFHYYEGHPMREVVFPIRALGQLGVKMLVVTNAAGGVNPDFMPGDLMLISDHISMQHASPLEGANLETMGPRFVDMTEAYDSNLRTVFSEVARTQSIDLKEGIYAAMRGPQYETPAEVQMLHRLGVSAVGMSTVPETIVARHLGIKVLGVSCITNMAAGLSVGRLSHDEVLQVGSASGSFLARLLHGFVEKLPAGSI